MTSSEYRAKRSPDDFALTEQGEALLASIPDNIRPVMTAEHLPHIINHMAMLCKDPRQIDAYFAELMFNTRGNRQGFPQAIASEISVLMRYYKTVVHVRYPCLKDIWEDDRLADFSGLPSTLHTSPPPHDHKRGVHAIDHASSGCVYGLR